MNMKFVESNIVCINIITVIKLYSYVPEALTIYLFIINIPPEVVSHACLGQKSFFFVKLRI